MTGLSQDLPGDHYFVRSIGEDGIRIGDAHYRSALILSADVLRDDWPPRTVDTITDEHLQNLLDLEPEVVLLGTGARQHFLHPERLAAFYRLGVGVEVMTTEAACRTFNVLVMDGRKVVAGLLPLDAGQTG